MKAVTANNYEAVQANNKAQFDFGGAFFCYGIRRTWDEEGQGMISVNAHGKDVEGELTTNIQNVNKNSEGVYYVIHIEDPLLDPYFALNPENLSMNELYGNTVLSDKIPEGFGDLSVRDYISQIIIGQDDNVTVIDDFNLD